MKAYKRITALLLLAAMLASMVSCGNEETSAETENTGSQNTAEAMEETEPAETLDSLEARSLVEDGLPDKNFEGRTFRILTYDGTSKDFLAEEMTGALVNDATYARNTEVMERFNVVLEVNGENPYGTVTSMIRNSITAGDNEFDLVSQHMIDTAKLALSHCYQDFNTIPNIDPSQPWWNASSYSDLSVAGQSFMLAGSISPYFLGSYYCVYMNKRLGEDYGIPAETIYKDVLDGKFTIDYYYSKIENTWGDVNGDGIQDEGDIYGLAAQVTSYATPFIYSFGEVTVKHDEAGLPVLDINEEKFSSMVEKVYKLFYESNGTITTDGWSLHSDTFMAGRALFMDGVFLHSYQVFTEMEDDYAILPYPKWDETQTDYHTMSDGSSPLVSVPVTVTDTEFVGIITEALCAEAWKTITPAVYDMALKSRGARDETSVQIIDMIERGAIIDFGFVFGDYSTMGFTMSVLMSQKNNNFTSYYASNQKAWSKKLEKLVSDFMKED